MKKPVEKPSGGIKAKFALALKKLQPKMGKK